MNIRCPHCDFAKEIPDDAIPEGTTRANCPRCGQSFPFTRSLVTGEPTFSLSTDTATLVCPSCRLAQPRAARCSQCGMVLSPETAANRYAGFWLRLVAHVIDGLALFAINMVCNFLFLGMGSLATGGMSGEGGGAQFLILLMFNTAIQWAYYVVFTGACGQTLGKMALRIKVVRTEGADLTYGRAFLREIPGKILSGLILGIGYLMVGFTQRKQGLHDMIADTYVVKL